MDRHPVLRCTDTLEQTLHDVADLDVGFMPLGERRAALHQVAAVAARLESLRLRLIAASSDLADAEGCRDIATWLAVHTRTARPTQARAERLAHALDRRWHAVAAAVGNGRVNPDQAQVIAAALDDLPDHVPAEVRDSAEARLVTEAATFGPRELRVLGRRILDIVAPEIGEDHERRALEAAEHAAHRATSLTRHRLGHGLTRLDIRVPDAIADRLLTYLHAYTSPRHPHTTGTTTGNSGGSGPAHPGSRHPARLGQAFCALLEALDPARLPLHGGDATTLIVTIDLATLRDGLGTATLGTHGRLTAGQTRRLACTARIIPAVLGSKSEVLDLGRSARLFTPAQRKAMALRDRTCRAHGCDTPAPWCEAHHHTPWSQGGHTNLADGILLCRYHHHRAHDHHYHHYHTPQRRHHIPPPQLVACRC